LQDAAMFEGSAEDNIRYGRLDASKAELRAARCRPRQEFIEKLPKGCKTEVGEHGVQSGLGRLLIGASSQVITYRLAAVHSIDRISLMDNGGIIAEGKHAGLVASSRLFAWLAAVQLGEGQTLVQGKSCAELQFLLSAIEC
jgi:ATP-binding cassette subfamily B protein